MSNDRRGSMSDPDDVDQIFQDPDLRTCGGNRHLSPIYFHMLTSEPRLDVDPTDEGLWLVSEPLKTVHKKGIVLNNQWFYSTKLRELVSGPKGTPRRDLHIRYNRAHLARGILKEVVVAERDAQGRFDELCRCGRRDEVLDEMDSASALRERNAFVRDLIGKRAVGEDEYARITRGTQIFNQRIEEHLARERLRKNAKPEAVPATPIYNPEDPEELEREARKKYRADLAEREQRKAAKSKRNRPAKGDPTSQQPGEAVSAGDVRRKKGARKRKGESKKPPAGAGRSTQPLAAPPKRSLSEALGGKTGFITNKEDDQT